MSELLAFHDCTAFQGDAKASFTKQPRQAQIGKNIAGRFHPETASPRHRAPRRSLRIHVHAFRQADVRESQSIDSGTKSCHHHFRSYSKQGRQAVKNSAPPVPGWVAIRKTEQIPIPTTDGKGIAQFIEVEVDAWRDPETGEIYLDGDAIDKMDRAKARYMGILTAEEIKALRRRLGLSQRELSELLKIGEKSWIRWESGRERPSHSMNLLLQTLKNGIIPLSYLQSQQSPRFSIWEEVIQL